MLRFDGRVVLVTGAGGGLGKEYALLFAQRGASVVVNDLGGSATGEGAAKSMADQVVDEIRATGGKAVANYDSVEHGEKLVETAIRNFGRIDIVINNAGILRDKSFINMTESDWDLIHNVHLRGAYSVTKAAWPHMKKQKYGRVIMTASNSGIYGNFGQANYSSAKLGLLGLSNTLAIEGEKYGVTSNTIVPTAGSRLTQTVLPPDLIDALKPSFVAPMVVWLCHESCHENGGVFEAAAGWYGRLRWYRSQGRVLQAPNGNPTTPEEIRDHWAAITSMGDSQSFSNGQEIMTHLMGVLSEDEKNSKTGRKTGASASGAGHQGKPDVAACRGFKFPDHNVEYNAKDAILYALGIGATTKNANELRFIYENDSDFCVLPTFGVVPSFGANAYMISGEVPGLQVDLSKLLHGEQYLEVFKPFPTDGKLRSSARIADVLDKGSGALVLTDVDVFDALTNERICFAQYATFLRGQGKFGGSKSSTEEKQTVAIPSRPPDRTYEQQTNADQAALYRLGSGDLNPLHIDPSFAMASGFKQPILHGLCSFGYSVRHILNSYAGGDVTKFTAAKARFTKPVLPGETLITEMWREGDRIHFQTKVKESGETAISGGYVQLKALEAAAGKSSGAGGGGSAELSSEIVFEEMKKRVQSQPEMAQQVNAIFQWIITKNGKEAAKWTVDLKNGKGDIYQGEAKEKAGVTLTLDDDDMISLVGGQLNPQQAFLSGKLKIKGNIMLTQKLQKLLKDQSKL